MYTVGRFLQVLGLILVPVGLFIGLQQGHERGALMLELSLAALGAICFIVGHKILQSVGAG